jgi:hypothetical protein
VRSFDLEGQIIDDRYFEPHRNAKKEPVFERLLELLSAFFQSRGVGEKAVESGYFAVIAAVIG